MAKINYTNINKGFWRTHDFDAYDAVLTENQAEYTYGATAAAELGAYNAEESPYRAVFIFADAEYETVVEGPNAGDERAISGTVTGFTLYDDNGGVIMTATELNGDLPYFLRMMDRGESFNAVQSLYAVPLTIIGANKNGRDPDDWQGDGIETGSHNDMVRAKGGNDFIQDKGGRDEYDGGDGYDTVSYETFQWDPRLTLSGIKADLKKGFIDGPDGHRDTVISIEGVRGTQKRDVFKGNAEDNGFMGYQGADVFNGRGGSDWASYRHDLRDGGDFGIIARLDMGWVRDGFGSKDKLKSIENVQGTDLADKFRDNSGANRFEGRDSDDTFIFTEGDDRAEGGGGADTFIYRGMAIGYNTIDDFEDGTDLIQIEELLAFGDLNIYDWGDDKVIDWGVWQIWLTGMAGASIDENDFILPPI